MKGRILEDAIDQKSTRKLELARQKSKFRTTATSAVKL